MAEVTTRNLKNERTVLKDVLPVDTPFLLGIFVGDICNFRCKYCIQSADETVGEKKQLIPHFLEWDTFKKIADSAAEFPAQIKTIMLSSIGEPLLHPHLPEMIAYLNKRNVAKSYEIVTNASKLTPELSRKLIDAGLTRLCISQQGVSKEKYKEICNFDIDYEQFVDNVKYFYEYSRGKCKLHIKTVDIALEEGDEKIFYDTYAPICDTIYVDKIIPAFKGVDYSKMILPENQFTKEQMDAYSEKACSSIFYTLYTLPDGTIAQCCDNPQPIKYGNILSQSLPEVWNGNIRTQFLIQHLTKRKNENQICAQCVHPILTTFPEDKLDGYEDKILSRIQRNI